MRTVAIVGFADKTFHYCLNSKADEMWSLNHLRLAKDIPRCDRVYEIHKRDWYLRKEVENINQYEEWLKLEHPFPIYMQKDELTPLVPSGVEYPYDKISDKLLSGLRNIDENGNDLGYRRYFTSSVSFMIAHAIYDGFKRIELYGIDMAYDTEYSYQKPNGEFWMGIALGKGIQVVVPDICNLCMAPVYAYEIIPYIDAAIIDEMLQLYDRRYQDYIVESQRDARELEADPTNEEKKTKYLKSSAFAYLHHGAVVACDKLLKDSGELASRQFVEMKRQEYINGVDHWKSIYNQKRALHDYLMEQGEVDGKLWEEEQDARASMYANLGALQLHKQLIYIIDMRTFKRELSLEIAEEFKKEDA